MMMDHKELEAEVERLAAIEQNWHAEHPCTHNPMVNGRVKSIPGCRCYEEWAGARNRLENAKRLLAGVRLAETSK
jgi:hypothetical protein